MILGLFSRFPWLPKLALIAALCAAILFLWERSGRLKAQLAVAEQGSAILAGQAAFLKADRDSQRAAYEAVNALQAEQREQLSRAQEQRRTVIREVRISDPNFALCLDQPVPPAYIRGMRSATGYSEPP